MPAQKDHYLYIFTPDLELALHVKVTSNAASACICSAELCCARSDSCNATPPFIFASKMALHSALVSLDGQPVDYIVWASKFGDEENTEYFTRRTQGSSSSSQHSFQPLVHNAIAGLYSLSYVRIIHLRRV